MLTLQTLKTLKQNNRENPIIYKLLSTIIGECEQISKNPSNNEIIGVLQKIYKDNSSTLEECPKNRVDKIQELKEENKFIFLFLPKQLTNEELSVIIGTQMANNKRLPDIMKYLNSNYKGQYDSKIAISIINSLL